MSNPKKAKRPKYELILILKEAYQKEGRPKKFCLNKDSLDTLLLFADRHTTRWNHPWQYVAIYRNMQFDPYVESKQLLFLNLDKRYS